MSVEGYTTLAETTLASGYTAGSGTMALTSGAAFPAAGLTFSVRVDTTGAIYTCTRSSNTLTVTLESGSDASLSSGVSVVHVMTKRALDNIRLNQNSVGAKASLPSVANDGDTYNTADGFYRYVRSLGAWVPFYAQFKMVEPVNGSFAWNNQAGATVSTVAGGVVLVAPASAGDDIRSREIAYPAAPFTLTIKFNVTMDGSNFANAGISLRDSGTGKLVTFGLGTNNGIVIGVNYWNTVTSFASSPRGTSFAAGPAPFMSLRLIDNATNRNWYFSVDGGITWVLFLTTTNTDFLTADKLGFFADSANSEDAAISLLSWEVV